MFGVLNYFSAQLCPIVNAFHNFKASGVSIVYRHIIYFEGHKISLVEYTSNTNTSRN